MTCCCWEGQSRKFDSNRHCDFLVVTSRICNQPQKIHFDTPKKSRVFGLLVDSLNMSLLLTPEKLMKVTSQCFEMYKTEKGTKLIGLLSFNSTNSVTCTTSASVFTTNSGRIAQSRPFISTSSKLELQSKKEFLWWTQNLKLCNGNVLYNPKHKW